jgi:para-nitrobenzyl esterase
MSVCAHLVSPQSRGLFHRAISQSGLCDRRALSAARADEIGAAFAQSLGCTDGVDVAACLRAKSADEIAAADTSGSNVLRELAAEPSFWPSVDGTFLPMDFRDAVDAAQVAEVPVIVGWNADEGTLFVLLAEQAGDTVDQAAYDAMTLALAEQSGLSVSRIRAQYSVDDYPDAASALADAIGDSALACPSRRAARRLAQAGAETYVYHFTYPDAAFQIPSDRPLGAFHSGEIQFVFGHPSAIGRFNFRDPDERALHQTMSGYWTRFARGAINDGAPVEWPRYDSTGDQHLVLDRETRVGVGADADVCVLWDEAP